MPTVVDGEEDVFGARHAAPRSPNGRPRPACSHRILSPPQSTSHLLSDSITSLPIPIPGSLRALPYSNPSRAPTALSLSPMRSSSNNLRSSSSSASSFQPLMTSTPRSSPNPSSTHHTPLAVRRRLAPLDTSEAAGHPLRASRRGLPKTPLPSPPRRRRPVSILPSPEPLSTWLPTSSLGSPSWSAARPPSPKLFPGFSSPVKDTKRWTEVAFHPDLVQIPQYASSSSVYSPANWEAIKAEADAVKAPALQGLWSHAVPPADRSARAVKSQPLYSRRPGGDSPLQSVLAPTVINPAGSDFDSDTDSLREWGSTEGDEEPAGYGMDDDVSMGPESHRTIHGQSRTIPSNSLFASVSQSPRAFSKDPVVPPTSLSASLEPPIDLVTRTPTIKPRPGSVPRSPTTSFTLPNYIPASSPHAPHSPTSPLRNSGSARDRSSQRSPYASSSSYPYRQFRLLDDEEEEEEDEEMDELRPLPFSIGHPVSFKRSSGSSLKGKGIADVKMIVVRKTEERSKRMAFDELELVPAPVDFHDVEMQMEEARVRMKSLTLLAGNKGGGERNGGSTSSRPVNKGKATESDAQLTSDEEDEDKENSPLRT